MKLEDILLTVEDRKMILEFLDVFESIIFDPTRTTQDLLLSLPDGTVRELLMERLGGTGTNNLSVESKRLRDEVMSIPVIKMTVAVELTYEQKTKITQFARSITGKQVFVEFTVDSDLIGGALIEGDGRVGEYSFRRYFERRIDERREANGI